MDETRGLTRRRLLAGMVAGLALAACGETQTVTAPEPTATPGDGPTPPEPDPTPIDGPTAPEPTATPGDRPTATPAADAVATPDGRSRRDVCRGRHGDAPAAARHARGRADT